MAAGADYMDQYDMWGGGGGAFAGDFGEALSRYGGDGAILLRSVTITGHKNPYGGGWVFGGETHADADTWLHKRLDERFINYGEWFSKQTDDLQSFLDAGGTSDPSGLMDGVNGLIYLVKGDVANAGISGLAMIPYIGDAAKLGRRGTKMVIHHIASNKHLTKYTPLFSTIAKKYNLTLDCAWNKI